MQKRKFVVSLALALALLFSMTTVASATASTTCSTRQEDCGHVAAEVRAQNDDYSDPDIRPVGPAITVITDPVTGAVTEMTANYDGSSTKTTTHQNGTVSQVTTDASGQVTTNVTLPVDIVHNANGTHIRLPIAAIPVVNDIAKATTINIFTNDVIMMDIGIPVSTSAPGTVVVMVSPNGSTEILKSSIAADGFINARIPNGAKFKIIDNSKDFEDVNSGDWFSGAVDFASSRELFSGTGAATFSPNVPMTRAMWMTVLARLNGVNTNGGSTWYEKGMEWAKNHQISDGSNPNGTISREQLVTMLWRSVGSPKPFVMPSNFTDTNQISGYARNAMAWAINSGIISGYSNGTLNPQGKATRAEVATFIQRFLPVSQLAG